MTVPILVSKSQHDPTFLMLAQRMMENVQIEDNLRKTFLNFLVECLSKSVISWSMDTQGSYFSSEMTTTINLELIISDSFKHEVKVSEEVSEEVQSIQEEIALNRFSGMELDE